MSETAGLLLVDKPQGLTSHDVVARGRKLAQTRRVGHAGTLDPAATGLLILGVNRATKLLAFLSGLPKTYSATVRLGASTHTDDAEGELLTDVGCGPLSREQIDVAVEQFRGNIMQVPAAVSAIKVGGKRAHQLVREGAEFTLAARPVTVNRFEVIGEPQPVGKYLDIEVEVDCSAGTYIRSLARDLGESLGVGGHLTRLARTRVGPWSIGQATKLEELDRPLPLMTVAEACLALYPELPISPREVEGMRYGQGPSVPAGKELLEDQIYTAAGPGRDVAGLVQYKSGRLRPVFVTNPV